MKRSERHHLKENPVAETLVQVRERLQARTREVTAAAALVVLAAAGAGGYFIWQQQMRSRAAALLADAMAVAEAPVVPPATADAGSTPPAPPAGSFPTEEAKLEAVLAKFLAAADAYPTTGPGITARYHAATTLAALGRADDAERQYREVISRNAQGLYGQMSRLGLADAQLRAGKHDAAIALYQEASALQNTDLPVEGILMQLGRAYLLAGKPAEAQQTFTRIVDEFGDSAYASEARREIDRLKAPGS